MKHYTTRKAGPLKWVIALIIFILAMTITFDEVEGMVVPGSNTDQAATVNPAENSSESGMNMVAGSNDPGTGTTSEPPPEIPEPATLLLLSAGLGALHLIQRRRKA